jgi:hypothetical protein
LCADGFFIRAQAMIRADGFRPRKIGEGLRAVQVKSVRAGFGRRCAANDVRLLRMQGIRKIRTRFLR